MQRVPELVEERVHVVEGEERGLAGRRLGEVAGVRDDRLRAEQAALVDEAVAPGPAAFVDLAK